MPEIAHLQERDPKSIPAVYGSSYRLLFVLALPAFASITVASPLISRLWIGRYEPAFVEFVAILSAGWLVNVLANPAYVARLGTGALRSVSIGCVTTVILNAALGVLAGRFAAPHAVGGPAVVASAAFSLASGYAIVMFQYHRENRVPFARLIPEGSGMILAAAMLSALFILFALRSSAFASPTLARPATVATAILLVMILIAAWRHPMRKRVWRWVFNRVPA